MSYDPAHDELDQFRPLDPEVRHGELQRFVLAFGVDDPARLVFIDET
jgi:hypothetical protein